MTIILPCFSGLFVAVLFILFNRILYFYFTLIILSLRSLSIVRSRISCLIKAIIMNFNALSSKVSPRMTSRQRLVECSIRILSHRAVERRLACAIVLRAFARVEEERLSVRVYDIGQSRDSRCRYKFNVDLVMGDKDYPSRARRYFQTMRYAVPAALDIRRLNRTGRFVIRHRAPIIDPPTTSRVKATCNSTTFWTNMEKFWNPAARSNNDVNGIRCWNHQLPSTNFEL